VLSFGLLKEFARSGYAENSAALQATSFVARRDKPAKRTHPLRGKITGLGFRA
jgi:hypothetical protein